MIIAIDPGNEQSAIVMWESRIISSDIAKNEIILNGLKLRSIISKERNLNDVLVVEMIASYGMPVGKTVFETCVWIGRFIEAWKGEYELIYRKDVKMCLCGSVRAKDSNIRQALIDKIGIQGTKKEPGPTYGIKADMWAALAVAVTYSEMKGVKCQ